MGVWQGRWPLARKHHVRHLRLVSGAQGTKAGPLPWNLPGNAEGLDRAGLVEGKGQVMWLLSTCGAWGSLCP